MKNNAKWKNLRKKTIFFKEKIRRENIPKFDTKK